MKFLENKYTSVYYSIIYNAKARSETLNYAEHHHILPRSLGGDNSIENLVRLTGREHFICHILLTKMTEGKARHSMIHAAIGMKRCRKYQNRYINSRLYESIKQEYAEIARQRNKGKSPSVETRNKMSLAGKGKPKSEETKLKMSISAKGKSKGPMSDEEKLKRSVSAKGKPSLRKGKKGEYSHTEEAKRKISDSNKRRTYSEETRAKLAAAAKAQATSRKEKKTTLM